MLALHRKSFRCRIYQCKFFRIKKQQIHLFVFLVNTKNRTQSCTFILTCFQTLVYDLLARLGFSKFFLNFSKFFTNAQFLIICICQKLLLYFVLFFRFSFRSSHRRCRLRKGVLKNFAKFTGKQLYQSLFLKTFQPQPGTSVFL